MSKAFNVSSFYDQEFKEHLTVAAATEKEMRASFEEMLRICVEAIRAGKKILFFGNGGSAGDSQHLATELVVRYRQNRVPIPAIALTTDTSCLTAIGNDLGFDQLFSRQVDALGQAGDIAIGITTSGQSPNVHLAFEKAKEKGLKTVALTGKGGGTLHGVVDTMLIVPSNTTARIQEMHIMLGQMLCDALEQELGLV
jgi:D-sedoheptulose 7-phosphate isomerase